MCLPREDLKLIENCENNRMKILMAIDKAEIILLELKEREKYEIG